MNPKGQNPLSKLRNKLRNKLFFKIHVCHTDVVTHTDVLTH